MAKRSRVKELEAMVSKHADVFEVTQQKRGGHICIAVTHCGKTRKLFTSSTPSDHRGIKNLESDLKKTVRMMEEA